jgi:hypothetical protein
MLLNSHEFKKKIIKYSWPVKNKPPKIVWVTIKKDQ